ncbi:MAG: hypothetical protein VYC42_09110 [Pseudomonadota bacterium]|nr:hypothetical protein [Pseudomonadota bacterium]
MRFCLVALIGLLGSWALPAPAQDDAARDCKIFDGRAWQSVGTVSRTACLEGIEQWVSEYNSQGFKFGLWGSMMLSADRNYFYRSPDGGKNWEALGLKSDLAVRVAEVPEPAAQAEADTAEAVGAMDAQSSGIQGGVPSGGTPAPAYDDGWAVGGETVVEAAPTPAPVVESVARAPAQPSVSGFDRRSCSLGVSAAWEQIGILTLRECAEALDRSPDSYDELGFKYGYWNGVFLAANASEILSSTDSRSWQPLIRRDGR